MLWWLLGPLPFQFRISMLALILCNKAMPKIPAIFFLRLIIYESNLPPSACCLPQLAWKESLCHIWQILQKFERNSETMWKYGNSLEFRQFNHHRTWRVTCLFGWKVLCTTKKVQEADSGNVCFSNVPFYAGWFSPAPCHLCKPFMPCSKTELSVVIGRAAGTSCHFSL